MWILKGTKEGEWFRYASFTLSLGMNLDVLAGCGLRGSGGPLLIERNMGSLFRLVIVYLMSIGRSRSLVGWMGIEVGGAKMIHSLVLCADNVIHKLFFIQASYSWLGDHSVPAQTNVALRSQLPRLSEL